MRLFAIVAGALLCVGVADASAQSINDAQIAHIVVTANQVDIDAGQLAASMASNPEVKKFGQQMVTDHTGVNKQAADLAAKLKVTPADNPTSQSLKAGGEKNVTNLKTLKGVEFDKAYVDHEVAYHQAVLDAVDKTLIPTGELRPVADTPFDFRTPTTIGARINESDEQLKFGNGYDHCWVISKPPGQLGLMARVTDPASGRVLELLRPAIDADARARLSGSRPVCSGALRCSMRRWSPRSMRSAFRA